VGESLKGIRRTAPLERVTTASLPALRKYVEATRLQAETGEEERALQLLEDAVQLDSTFAMAWRRIAVILNNRSVGSEQARTAIATAMRFRDRLSDEERAFTEGYYYTRGPEPDYIKAAAAYEDVLRRDSTNSTALNNLSVLYSELRRYDDAAEVLWRSLSASSATGSNYANLLRALFALRDTAGIDSVAKLFAARLPDNSSLWEAEGQQLYARGIIDSSFAQARIIARSPKTGRQALVSNGWMAEWAAMRGRPNESFGYLQQLRKVQMADAGASAAAMLARTDSAFVAAFWGGAPSEAAALLQRAIAPAPLADIKPVDRPWEGVLLAAAYAGDTLSARIAHAGYMKDKSGTQGLRTFWDARANAYLAIAREQHDEAIAQLRIAFGERASPNNEESFLMAMSHERAGRPDSAIVWLARTLTTPSDGFGDGIFPPAAKRRLAELLEAKGDLRGAIRYYEAFLDDWTQPEPAQAEVVRAVKARVAALRAKLAPG
jgi:Tfp pilus assembly protein PilF